MGLFSCPAIQSPGSHGPFCVKYFQYKWYFFARHGKAITQFFKDTSVRQLP